LLYLTGFDPLDGLYSLLIAPFTSWGAIGSVLEKTAPLILTGLAAVFAWQVGVFNIGMEGQMIIGGIVGGIAAVYLTGLPAPLHIFIACLAAFIAGAIYAGVPGYLFAYFGADEIVTTVMLNYIAVFISSYLLNNQLRSPTSVWAQSSNVQPTAELMRFLPPSRANIGIVISTLIAFVLTYLLFRTTFGYEIRMLGFNKRNARYGGINVRSTILKAIALSGGLAGLAGVIEVMGIHKKILLGFSANYGWDGIAVALIAQTNPLAVIPAGILMGAMRVGGRIMGLEHGIPLEMVRIVVAVILMFVTAIGFFKIWDSLLAKYRRVKE
jgi:simple sugar transport system permease protein